MVLFGCLMLAVPESENLDLLDTGLKRLKFWRIYLVVWTIRGLDMERGVWFSLHILCSSC